MLQGLVGPSDGHEQVSEKKGFGLARRRSFHPGEHVLIHRWPTTGCVHPSDLSGGGSALGRLHPRDEDVQAFVLSAERLECGCMEAVRDPDVFGLDAEGCLEVFQRLLVALHPSKAPFARSK